MVIMMPGQLYGPQMPLIASNGALFGAEPAGILAMKDSDESERLRREVQLLRVRALLLMQEVALSLDQLRQSLEERQAVVLSARELVRDRKRSRPAGPKAGSMRLAQPG
jgi:hypothetical protein